MVTGKAAVLAEQLRDCDQLRRYAEAGIITKMCELADEYHIEQEDLIDVLEEKHIRLGGTGTPTVSEYLTLELAGLLRCSPAAAASRLADALDLKHRHPHLFTAVTDLTVEPARALRAARLCHDLAPETAEAVTDAWLAQQAGLSWTGCFKLLDRLVLEADRKRAEQKAREAAAFRGVWTWGLDQGSMRLSGQLDVLDARYLDESLSRMADVIAPDNPGLDKNQLRAKALGIFAHPAYALALIQQAAQPALTDPEFDEKVLDQAAAPIDGNDGIAESTDCGAEPPFTAGYVPLQRQGYEPHTCRGHVCGTVTTPLSKLRPRAEVVIHIATDALGNTTGSARIEKAGNITTQILREILRDVDVTIQPLIDLPEMPPVDNYAPPPRMRRALLMLMNTDMFPFSTTTSLHLDLDHTIEFRNGRRKQTRIGNLAPINRRAHRAKTAGIWKVQQPLPGMLAWQSPLGYRYHVIRDGLTKALE